LGLPKVEELRRRISDFMNQLNYPAEKVAEERLS